MVAEQQHRLWGIDENEYLEDLILCYISHSVKKHGGFILRGPTILNSATTNDSKKGRFLWVLGCEVM
jgi:hypothetical protein